MESQDAVTSLVERTTTRIAQETSRRGFLATIGKLAVAVTAATGAKALLLPIDRRTTHAGGCGGTWCGMSGHPCSCCGGSDTSCPNGTSQGSYWKACCNGRQIRYYDCCYSASECCSTPISAGGADCCPGCTWCSGTYSNWCGSEGNCYKCTLAVDVGQCPQL